MLLMLGLRPEREASIRRPGGLTVEPEVPVHWHTDRFGNRSARLVAPAGRLVLSGWFEAYLDGRWYTFDARHNVPGSAGS
jgi:hypothetical protein